MEFSFRMKNLLHLLYDIVAVNVALFFAHYFRFGTLVLDRLGDTYLQASLLNTLVFIAFFVAFRFYKRIWYYAGVEDYFNGIVANLFAGFVLLILQVFLGQIFLSLVILATILTAILTVGGRYVFRYLRKMKADYLWKNKEYQRTLIIGKSEKSMSAGKSLKWDRENKIYPIGILGLEGNFQNRYVVGIPVFKKEMSISQLVTEKNVDLLLLVTEDLSYEERKSLLAECRKTGKPVKILRKPNQDPEDASLTHLIKNVKVEDILGKKEISLDREGVLAEITDKIVLITGAAGHMGAKLAEALGEFSPEKLLLLDVNENSLGELHKTLGKKYPEIAIEAMIISLNDKKQLENMMKSCAPDIVFHCAFLNKPQYVKNNPGEVIKNNVIGTYNLVKATEKQGAKKLLMLSASIKKEPKNIITISKKICEMLLQSMNQRSKTKYYAVRFEELENNGDHYLKEFQQDYEKGELLTVDSPDATCFLFNYNDAVKQILNSLVLTRGGEVFVLDPGKPVNVYTLAKIFLEGLEDSETGKKRIQILNKIPENNEEVFQNFDKKTLNRTEKEGIFVLRSIFDNFEMMEKKLEELSLTLDKGEPETVVYQLEKTLKELVPDYHDLSYDGGGYPLVKEEEGKEKKRIWLSSPHMGGLERHYVEEAFDTNWVAPIGPNVNEFEKEMAEYIGVKAAAAMTTGTAAIHIALRLLEMRPGDEIYCSTLTFSGSANPIMYEQGVPVFIDAEPNSWNMSPVALEKALQAGKIKGKMPKAVIVVNLYGQSADFTAIQEVCNRYDVPIIEDAAESLGGTYKNRRTGTFGKFGIFSFNGNKIITTSGGGMLVSDDEEAIQKAKFLITQARDPARHYQHSELGFNYRMSNIVAGIGRGQLKVLDLRVEQKKKIFDFYQETFKDLPDITMMPVEDFGQPNYWLSVITLDANSKVKPLDIILALEKEDIESRPVWKPMHMQPFFRGYSVYSHGEHKHTVAEDLFNRGLCLPSDTKMTTEDLQKTAQIIKGLWNR